MNTLAEFSHIYSWQSFTVLIDAAVKSGVILIIARLITSLMKRASAASRHLVWTLTLTSLLGLPALSILLPSWQIPILPNAASVSSVLPFSDKSIESISKPFITGTFYQEKPLAENLQPENNPSSLNPLSPALIQPQLSSITAKAANPVPFTSALSWPVWILLIWLLGAGISLFPYLLGTMKMWNLTREADGNLNGILSTEMSNLVHEMDIKCPVRLLQCHRNVIPMNWGFNHPRIVLPSTANSWPVERLHWVLLHELAHIQRWDCLTQGLARLVCALYWFNPLTWLSARRLRIESERACDDLVLSVGAKAADYASHLLEIVRSLHLSIPSPIAAVSMARPSNFENRLLAILDSTRNRRGLTRFAIILASAVLACILLPLAAIHPTVRAEESAAATHSIRIADYLGDPISSGQIEIAGKNYSFQDGTLKIPDLPKGRYSVSVQADGYAGYAPKTQTFQFPLSEDVGFMLEYLCSLDFAVYYDKEKANPAADTEVILWQGPFVQRPVPKEISVVKIVSSKSYPIKLQLEKNGARIVDYQPGISQFGLTDQNGYADLQKGDLLIGIAGFAARPGDQLRYPVESSLRSGKLIPRKKASSFLLRAWDTLIAQVDSQMVQPQKSILVEAERGNSRFYNFINEMGAAPRGEIVSQGKTDTAGRCHFENLPAGTYFVQARKGNLRSALGTVFPIHEGGELILQEGARVRIRTHQAPPGVTDTMDWGIAGADVVLKSVDPDRGGLLTAKTGDLGLADFEIVPWGKYLVTVTPPEKYGLAPQTQELNVDDLYYDLRFNFENKEKLYTAIGKVIRADTHEPVEGYYFSLYRTTYPSGTYGEATSDAEGRFVFSNLLPGQYMLNPNIHRNHYNGYLPPGWFLMSQGMEFMGDNLTPEINVINEDINSIEYQVLPGIQTRFQGIVTYPDGTPAPGVNLSIDSGRLGILEPKKTTDENGRFEISIVTTSEGIEEFNRNFGFSGSGMMMGFGMAGGGFGTIKGGTADNSESTVSAKNYSESVSMTHSGIPYNSQDIGSNPNPSGSDKPSLEIFAMLIERKEIPEGIGYFGGEAFISPGSMVRAQGKQTVPFSVGRTVSDIHITINSLERNCTVEGILTTEDGKPTQVRVIIIQEGEIHVGKVNSDGTFKIENLRPGKLSLNINPEEKEIETKQYGKREIKDYCREIQRLEIPENQKTLSVNIQLVKAGQIAGKVLHTNGEPAIDASVMALDSKTGAYSGMSKTDENGLFWLNGLRLDKEYNLNVIYKDNSRKFIERRVIKPSDENITITLE